jgi:hypothetical protein
MKSPSIIILIIPNPLRLCSAIAPFVTPPSPHPSTSHYASFSLPPGMDHSPSLHRTCSLSRLGRISRPALCLRGMNVCVAGCVMSRRIGMRYETSVSLRSHCGLWLRMCERKRICVSSWTWCLLAHVVCSVVLLNQGGMSRGEVVAATITTMLCTPGARVAAVSWEVETDRRGGYGKDTLGKEGDQRGESFCDMMDGKPVLRQQRLGCCRRSDSFEYGVF